MLFKNKATIPDIVYDGIPPDGVSLQDNEHKICIGDNGTFNFVFMDASHDFDSFSKDVSPYTLYTRFISFKQ